MQKKKKKRKNITSEINRRKILTTELHKVNSKHTGRKVARFPFALGKSEQTFLEARIPDPHMYPSSLILPFASDVGHDCPPWLRDRGSELVPALHCKRLSPKTADLSKWGGPAHRCKQTG